MENDLGIGPCDKKVCAEFIPQFNVVVDFTVVGNPIAGTIAHRLMTGLHIDDAEPAMSKPNVPARMLPDIVPIRAPMFLQMIHGWKTSSQFGDLIQGEVQ
jgi:hypothetical protein